MIVKDNVQVFICEHCGKKLFRKHAMEKHEIVCSYNPKNIPACSGCIFLKETQVSVFYESNTEFGYHETEVNTKGFHCDKKNIGLYPFKVVKKGLLQKYPETFYGQHQMPEKCDDHKNTSFIYGE